MIMSRRVESLNEIWVGAGVRSKQRKDDISWNPFMRDLELNSCHLFSPFDWEVEVHIHHCLTGAGRDRFVPRSSTQAPVRTVPRPSPTNNT